MAGKFGQSLEPIGNWVPTRIVLVHHPHCAALVRLAAHPGLGLMRQTFASAS